MRSGANAFLRILRRLAPPCAAAAAWATGAAAAVPSDAIGLRDGEALTYSVRWGFIPSVGRIKITADSLGSGSESVLRVTTTTWTWGLARGLFPFDGRGESVYREPSGLLISTSEWSTYRNKVVKNSLDFNYGRLEALYTDDINPSKTRKIPMPRGDPSDLILALIRTRYWNMRPGEKRDALVVFEDQFYPLTINAEPAEYVVTTLGVFKAVVLVPRMEKSPPLGMFKKGSTVRVWIESDDARHLPVRFEVGFRFGAGTATLIDYSPPK
ncbi:MAG TPA: DUF3108 domain-containing protein [Opitutaceae bacterium]|nr:DUF3108 domain-containing protein [Opitutaceae bacterium]